MRRFIVGYLDLVAKGILLLLFIGLPVYYIVVKWLGLHPVIFLFVYMLIVFVLSKYIQRVTFGNYFLETFEKWVKERK
jgi:hypothetical protein